MRRGPAAGCLRRAQDRCRRHESDGKRGEDASRCSSLHCPSLCGLSSGANLKESDRGLNVRPAWLQGQPPIEIDCRRRPLRDRLVPQPPGGDERSRARHGSKRAAASASTAAKRREEATSSIAREPALASSHDWVDLTPSLGRATLRKLAERLEKADGVLYVERGVGLVGGEQHLGLRARRLGGRTHASPCRCQGVQQSMCSALLGADSLPDVSTAVRTTSVGPGSRQYVIVLPPPIRPSSEKAPFRY